MTSNPTRRRKALVMDIPVLRSVAMRVPLGPFERALVQSIDGARSMQELASMLSVTTAEVAAVCTRLYDLEVIDLVPPRRLPTNPELELDLDADWDAHRDTVLPEK